MFSFSAPLWGRRNVRTLCHKSFASLVNCLAPLQPIESHYHDKKKLRKLSKFLQTLKSCFGRSTEVDIVGARFHHAVHGLTRSVSPQEMSTKERATLQQALKGGKSMGWVTEILGVVSFCLSTLSDPGRIFGRGRHGLGEIGKI